MDVMQAIRERRSIRKYKTQPVPDDMVNKLLEAVRLAPSWANTQCWRLVIVRDQETRNRLADTVKSTRPPTGRNMGTEAIRAAPLVIVACAERGKTGAYTGGPMQGQLGTDKGEYWYMFDVALALENVALAAHEMGLGTLHLGMFDTPEVRKILGVPDDIAIVEMMPVGWPDEQPAARPRKELREFVSYEKYPTGS